MKLEMKYEDYPLKTYDKIRFRDTDKQGHVNNAMFSTFFETGRTEMLYLNKKLTSEGCMFVLANNNMTLRGEIFWPGTVEIGTCVQKVGNSSIHVFQSLYQNNELVATAETVIVQINQADRKSSPLSLIAKEILRGYSCQD